MNTAEAARDWAATWQRAWETVDLEAIVALYAQDAVFSSPPHRLGPIGIATCKLSRKRAVIAR